MNLIWESDSDTEDLGVIMELEEMKILHLVDQGVPLNVAVICANSGELHLPKQR